MKRTLLLLLVTLPAIGGEFVNLTFDEPDLTGPLTPIYPGGPLAGNAAQIIPGWNITVGGEPLTSTTWSPFNLGGGAPSVSLVQHSPGDELTRLGLAYLELHSPTPPAPEIRLNQTGTIPADAAGLWIFGTGHAQMFINGERVGDTIATPIADVSRYAGQEVNLEFLVASGGSIRFDILGFVPVPEPQTWALLGTGLAAVYWLTRRK